MWHQPFLKHFLTCPCVALSSSCAFPTFSHILALRNAVSCHSILHTAGKTNLKLEAQFRICKHYATYKLSTPQYFGFKYYSFNPYQSF